MQRQKSGGRDQLGERRMLGVAAEVGVLPVFEAGEEVGGLIEGLRLLAGGGDEKDREDGQKCGGDEAREGRGESG